MNLSIALSVTSQPNYPVDVGFRCGSSDSYQYDYSYLSYNQESNKPYIERIHDVYQTYTSFSTETLVSSWKTSGQITYSNENTQTAYASRGEFFFEINSVSSHPVLICIDRMSSMQGIANEDDAKLCPATFGQIPDFMKVTFNTSTVNGYEFYSNPAGGLVCGYKIEDPNAGTLLPKGSHSEVNGKNLYVLVLFYIHRLLHTLF